MKLKLNKSQFIALYELLQSAVANITVTGIEAKLIHAIMQDVYRKFYVRAFDVQKRIYTIKLSECEACAWYLFFSRFQLPQEAVFEANLLHIINNDIHQKYTQ